MFRSGDIIFLIGAGCSAEAGIAVSSKMRQQLEDLLRTNHDMRGFSDLYNYVKGSIIQHDCANGNGCSEPDIERLVITLTELEKHPDSLLFPFIGSWSPRLQEITKQDFGIVRRFRREILKQLKAWVMPPNFSRDGEYYRGFFRFQTECNFALRVFSLNYDLCMERNAPSDESVMRGFDPSSRMWNSALFDTENDAISVYLYKMHGSINWQRNATDGRLREADYSDNPELIFGTDSKMQSIDPYLFYAYEFRRCCLEAKVIITVGYSFRDKHITSIIQQALQHEPNRKLLVISDEPEAARVYLSNSAQFVAQKETAKAFLDLLSLARIMNLTGIREDDLLTTRFFRSDDASEPVVEAEKTTAS